MTFVCVYMLLIFLGVIRCDGYMTTEKNYIHNSSSPGNETEGPDILDIKIFYEVFCPHCVNFERDHFENVINVLGPYLFIHTYPYGNANTTLVNGEVTFECQHGPKECYGNTLHACALNHLTNHTEALLFNICMMGMNGSDDATAEKCAHAMNINIDPIFQCAKIGQGIELLRQYGVESKKANFKRVPFVLVNGRHWTGTDFMQDICGFFKNPPIDCLN